MKQYTRLMFIIILAVVLSFLAALLFAHIIGAEESEPVGELAGAIIWQDTCQGGTWIVIENETYDEWAVWCAKFNWVTRELTWRWGRECEPHYSTEVIVRENILGTPKAICRYKY